MAERWYHGLGFVPEGDTLPEQRVRLVALHDFYAFYDADDHAFEHVMLDPAARLVTPEEVVRQWPEPRQSASARYAAPGQWPLHVAALHLGQLGIPFSYLDVGANVGTTTFMTAILFQRLGWSAPVIAFEPHPHICELLRRGVAVNGLGDHVQVVEAACSDVAGIADFFMTPAQTPASSLLSQAVNREFVVWNQPTRVKTVRLDEFLSGHDSDSLILKIDAEGADFKVLDGLGDQLLARLCIGQIEFLPMILDAYSSPEDYLLKLTNEFELFDLSMGDQLVSRIPDDPQSLHAYVETVRARRPFGAGDILFVPRRLPEREQFRARLLNR